MKKLILFVFVSSLPFLLVAQKKKNSSIDVGINVSSVFTTLLGNDNGVIDSGEFPFIVKFNRKKSTIRLGLGISSLFTDINTPADQEQSYSNEGSFQVRVGYEYKTELHSRVKAYYGIDALGGYIFNENLFSNVIDATTIKEIGYTGGFGPVYGFEFKLTERIYLNAEGSFYLYYTQFTRTEEFTFNPQNNKERDIQQFRTAITPPTWLYLVMKF